MASAGPYASLHLAPDRSPRQYPTIQFFTGRMPFLPPKQQRQSTEGRQDGNKCISHLHQTVQIQNSWNEPQSQPWYSLLVICHLQMQTFHYSIYQLFNTDQKQLCNDCNVAPKKNKMFLPLAPNSDIHVPLQQFHISVHSLMLSRNYISYTPASDGWRHCQCSDQLGRAPVAEHGLGLVEIFKFHA